MYLTVCTPALLFLLVGGRSTLAAPNPTPAVELLPDIAGNIELEQRQEE